MADNNKPTVEVSPQAFCSMVLHAGQNPSKEIHGLLIGSMTKRKVITIESALPVCHEPPTKPLVETAMALASSSGSVVGWYTAPEHITDTQPGPVPLRIVANMASFDNINEQLPVLILLDNAALAGCLKGDKPGGEVLKGLGKDFGQQWLEPLSLKVTDPSKAFAATSSAFGKDIKVVDLVNHFEDDTSEWLTNEALSQHVDKVTT